MIRITVNVLFLLLLTSFFSTIQSQELTKKELIKAVQEADVSYYYDEDYEKAATLFEPLLKIYPNNSNLAAKLGICYLNIDGKKQEALELLKKASANIVASDKEYVEYGEKAPLDTYMYLAEAYHQNDSLDKALKMFNDVKKKLASTEVFREEYIDNQIRDCRYAIEMKKKPLTIISELFAPWLKDYPGASNPVLAKNDSVFIFTQKTEGKTRILCSYKTKGKWNEPKDITKQLGGYDRFYSNSITGDGKLLVLYMDDGGDGNLYFCHRKDSTWSKIKSPGKPINTIYWESHGFITPDGNTIYFSSNRPRGIGELDIWTAEKKPDGTWDEPVNCGEVINTAYNEDTPFFDPANNALIFSSVGHISMGGYDVFRSIFRNGGWTNPVGMPYAFNTISQNTNFILNNNAPGFVGSRYDEKNKSRNIYSLVAIDPGDEITSAEGAVTLKDGLVLDPRKVIIKLLDAKKNTLLKYIPVTTPDGKIKFNIKPGEYQLFVNYPGYKTDTINLSLPLYNLSHFMAVNSTLIPAKVFEGQFLSIKNVLFEFDSFVLDDQAKSGLEALKSILTNYPDLKIEISGYTDAKGSTEYNKKLADKRAQAVIGYLKSSAIPESRFIKKAFGESNFAAVNTNGDGTDNPEGRKYNRRVAFGIVDPQTGVVLRQETYTPEHLRLASSMKYSIVLKKSAERLSMENFDGLKLNGMLFVRAIESDSVSLYALGVFYNKPDAIKYLGYVKEKGFTEAYIANQYDLTNALKTNGKIAPIISTATGNKVYTIQLKATKSPVDLNLFKEFKGIKEMLGDDGYYRYVMGEYDKFSKAKEALVPVLQAGYKDAFIREINLLTE
jgi:outer membrane protein OmpA-like peptidoglycan-associated protein/tetratricopeptide (TPR) repeat protein